MPMGRFLYLNHPIYMVHSWFSYFNHKWFVFSYDILDSELSHVAKTVDWSSFILNLVLSSFTCVNCFVFLHFFALYVVVIYSHTRLWIYKNERKTIAQKWSTKLKVNRSIEHEWTNALRRNELNLIFSI